MFSKNNFTLHILILIVYLIFLTDGTAQPYTRFSDQIISPVFLNPAYSGMENGKLVFTNKYKSHLSGGRPYNVLYTSVISSIPRGYRKKHWIGLGIDYFKDSNRYNNHNSSKVNFNFAYHISLGKKDRSTMSIGYRIGLNKWTLSTHLSDLLINQEVFEIVNGSPLNTDSDILKPVNNLVSGGGLLFRTEISKELNLEISISGDSEIEPRRSLEQFSLFGPPGINNIIDCAEERNNPLCGSQDIWDLPRFRTKRVTRFTSILALDYRMTDRLSINPRLLIQNYDEDFAVLPNLLGDYLFNENFSLIVGGGINSYDPMFYTILLGAHYNRISLTLSYDTNFEKGWTPGFLEEALELSFRYSLTYSKNSDK